MAGGQKTSQAATASTAQAATRSGRSSSGSTTATTGAVSSARRSGGMRPRRSTIRPVTVVTTAPRAAETTNTVAMPAAPTPCRSSCSGSSVPSMPNRAPGMITNHSPSSTRRLVSAARHGAHARRVLNRRRAEPAEQHDRAEHDGGETEEGRRAGSRSPRRRAPARGSRRRWRCRSMPPSTRPRRSTGVSPVSHAVASGQAMPPPAAPCTNRATTSPGYESSRPSAIVETASRTRPPRDRRAQPDARRDEAGRQRDEERAERVGRVQQADLCLRQPEVVLEQRQQRRERREQQRLEQGDGARRAPPAGGWRARRPTPAESMHQRPQRWRSAPLVCRTSPPRSTAE